MNAYETAAENSSGTAPYSTHIEPPRQGGCRYIRCERCTAEVIGTDPDRLLHKRGCPHGDR